MCYMCVCACGQMMPERDPDKEEVDRFILDEIDTVPHLEALLLLWNSRPKQWSVDEMGEALFLTSGAAKEILEDLVRHGLIAAVSGKADIYIYASLPEKDQLIAAVDTTYRKELIRISRLIHAKPSAAVRAFARAFRFKKDRD